MIKNQQTPKKNKLHWLLFLMLFITASAANAQVTGTVFRDFNGNGSRDANEPLVSGITVNAYGTSGILCGSATTAGTAAPNYSVTGCGTGQVRVEFIIPTSGNCVNSGIDYSSFVGSNNATSVQFVNGNSTSVNFALHNPNDYNQGAANTEIFIPAYISGDPLVAGTVANSDWFFSYPYNNAGTRQATPATRVMNGSVIGSVWGVAYSKQASKVFTSAFLKRHTGLGALGTGGIYMLTPTATSFNVNQFYDLDANGHRTRAAAGTPAYGEGTSYSIASNSIITYLGSNDALTGEPAGLGVVGTNSQRGLTSNPTDPSYDPATFDQVGKVGLGDLEISDDGKYLFVMNLYSRKVFRLELNDAYNPTSVVSVTSYDVPNPGCTNGEYRPFALKYSRGKLYAGVVCSGENAGTNVNLSAYFYELNNPTGAASFNASALVTIPLDYTKTGDYNPWTNNSAIVSGSGAFRFASPILSDIEFTDNGDMVFGIMDRSGHQWGENNRKFLKTTTTSATISTSGDVLVAGLNCSTGAFTLENNGTFNSANGITLTGSSNTNEGPGGKEFFDDNSPSGDPHDETAVGSLAVLKGAGHLLTTAFAQNTRSGDHGTVKFSTTDGSIVSGSYYEVNNRNDYNDGVFAKANALGDIELTGEESPIQVGNRVWVDTDGDGIQDAGENPISGVTVQLVNGGGTVIATATTDADGNYYFSNSTGTTTASAIYGVSGLTNNTNYCIRIPNAQGGSKQAALGTNVLTITDAGSGANQDFIDNDGTLSGNNAQACFTTGGAGENNHTYDFGFTPAPTCVKPSAGADQSACGGTCATLTGTNLTTGTWTAMSSNATGATLGSTTAGVASVCFTNASSGTYSFIYTVTGGCSDTMSVTVTAKPSAGVDATICAGNCMNITGTANTGTWTAQAGNPTGATLGSTTAGIASVCFTSASAGTYGFIYTVGACTDTMNVVVNAKPNAGADKTTCYNNGNNTVTLAATGTGVWTAQAGNAGTSTITTPSNATTTVTNFSVAGTYNYIWTNGSCSDTMIVVVTPSGSVGNYVWTDTNGDGLNNEPTSAGINVVTVELWNATTNTLVASTVTANNGGNPGYYNFVICNDGDYYVKFPTTNAGNSLTTQTSTAATDNNSDANASTGVSPTFTINTNGAGTAKDNPTIDAGYIPAPTCVKPSAGADQSVCGGTCVTLTGTNLTTGSWTAMGSNAAGATLGSTTAGIASVCFTNASAGTYSFIYTVGACTDTMNVVVNAKPNAGLDQTTCFNNGNNTVTLAATGTGVWTVQAGNAGTSTITTPASATTTVTNFSVAGTYNYIWTNGSCSDTMSVVVTPSGSVGNYVWTDTNGDGLNNEPTSAGINGVTVELWNATTNTLVSTTVTANNGGNPGYYYFIICTDGDYYVKFPTTNAGNNLTTQTSTAATDNNSDANTTTGFSPTFTINTNGAGTAKDNPTIDAGYVVLITCTPTTSSTPVSVCSTTMPYTWNGTSYNAAGTYTKTLTNAAGCDSVATLVLTVKATSTSSTSLSVCSNALPYLWNGINRNAAGTYTYVTTNSVGCDSTATLVLTVKATSTSSTSVSVCSNTLPYLWNGINRNAAGTYTYTTTNSVGCDSIATLVLTVNPLPATPTCAPITICAGVDAYNPVMAAVSPAGGTIVWNTGNSSTATSYTYTVSNACGMSSCTNSITRTAAPAAPTCAIITICTGVDATSAVMAAVSPAGGTIAWNTGNATTATYYTYTVTNSCGSQNCSNQIVRTPTPSSITCNPVSVCVGVDATTSVMSSVSISGGTIAWNTGNATTATSYTYTLTNACGSASCTNTITRISLPATPTCAPITICEGLDAYNMVMAAVSPTGGSIVWNTGNASTATSYTYTLSNACGNVSCTNTITRTAAAIVGNYVWADTNRNGLQDEPASLGINYAWVTLYKETTPGNFTQVAGVSTANDGMGNPGYYQFKVCDAGNYKVKFPTSQNGLNLTTQNGTPATDGNSDADTATGFSPVFVLDPNGTAIQKNNTTIDAGYKPATVTSGGGGGVESKTIGDVIAVRLYGNAINSTTQVDGIINGVRFNNSGAIVNGTQDLSLNALIPATVSNTDNAYVSTPTDLVNFTNAVEVLAVDYTKGSSTKAVAFGTKTLGDVYSHTKPICDRLKGAELQEVKNITVNGFNLMAYKVRQRTGETEYAMNLSAGTAANRNTISLQSNWFTDSYQQDEKLYNFQLWAVSYEMVTAMATDIISKLQANGAVNTVTNADLPKAYISKGSRKGTDLTLTVNNNTAATSGYFELHEKANETAAPTTRQVAFTVAANAATNVTMPVKDNYEGDIYVYLNNKLTDLVYLADGTWSIDYNNNNTTIQQFNIANESNPTTNSNEHRLLRNVEVAATTKDYVSIYKTMMGGGIEQNVNDYNSLLFNANTVGAGSVKITLIKKSITNWNDQYSYTATVSDSKEYAIGLNSFKSSKFNTAINANDIVAVNFSFITGRNTVTNMTVNLSKVRFSTATVNTVSSETLNVVSVYPNPTMGRFTTTFTSDVAQALVLKVTDVVSGRIVKTQFINATKGANKQTIELNNNSTSGNYVVTLEGDGVKYNAAKLIFSKQ